MTDAHLNNDQRIAPTPPETDVPRMTRSNEVVSQVMADHLITQARLADETGIDRSDISRICHPDASRTVPPDVIRTLWRLTKDQRIAQLALGEAEHLVVSMPIDALAWPVAVNNAITSAGRVIALLASTPEQPPARRAFGISDARSDLDYAINAAINQLCAARRALEAPAAA